MKNDNRNPVEQVKRLKENFRRSGIRLTPQRLEIFREVINAEDHPDAEIIYARVREKMPTVSLDTIYRSLWLFVDMGLISTLGLPRGRTKFDANMEHHHHFVCTRCGVAYDFSSTEYNSLKVPDAVKEYGNVEKSLVEFRGVCQRCLKKGVG